MLIKVFGAAVQGIDATLITIEVNSSRGCMFYLVGLPDSAVKESHQRIISALQVNGYKMPTTNIVVNMAPADIRKEGSAYDLPLAIGLLGASETISSEKFSRYLLMGELSLDGSIQPIKGALPIAIKAREDGFEGLIIPQQNAREAAVVNQLKVYGVSNIREVIEFFNNERELEPTVVNTTRFGNVLGSNGSVIPRFKEQIENGGPVTVTHPDIIRFFMTIPEACRLVMEAVTMGEGNEIFVFEMGKAVKIVDLATRMIELAGYRPDEDIKIEFTGLRPGEKLYEEVLSDKENTIPTENKKIMIAKVRRYEYADILDIYAEFEKLSRAVRIIDTVRLMKKVVPEFKSKNSKFEVLDKE